MDAAIRKNIDYHARLDRNGGQTRVMDPVMRRLADRAARDLRAANKRDQQTNEAETSGEERGEQSTPTNQS